MFGRIDPVQGIRMKQMRMYGMALTARLHRRGTGWVPGVERDRDSTPASGLTFAIWESLCCLTGRQGFV